MGSLKRWWSQLQQTSVWRAWKRYGDSRGNLLAGGVGYFAFFSVFPAVLLAFTVFGVVLRNQPELLDRVKDSINQMLPGFVKTPSNPRGIINVSAPTKAALSVSGVVAVVGLVLAGTGWLSALRDAIRQIFGVKGAPGNPVLAKLRDLGVLVVLGVAIVLSAVVGSVAGAASQWLARLLGLGGQGWILTLVALVIGVLLDASIIMVMLRLLTGVDVPRRGLRNAAVFGGLGLTLLKKFGTVLLSGTLHNALFASFALVVGLLVWLNFMSRVILVSAAWAANDLDTVRGTGLSAGQEHKLLEGPAPQALDSLRTPLDTVRTPLDTVRTPPHTVRTRTDAGLPTFGQRAADRTSVAAGVVLGATAAFALGGLARGVRALTHRR
ncbi:YihY/virulence factor BrkB family protein [Pedococcus sp. 5OH_020]|uniref:YihY/virulence factor BrkB family protein n=1 Tax=Pedococcus sp. 5OH_020 TaxID=2989814 RepID=UPI0022E9A80B|nr:YihY/virulence factor BrkB family protein [Pedococcus sp. 5OH_020]